MVGPDALAAGAGPGAGAAGQGGRIAGKPLGSAVGKPEGSALGNAVGKGKELGKPGIDVGKPGNAGGSGAVRPASPGPGTVLPGGPEGAEGRVGRSAGTVAAPAVAGPDGGTVAEATADGA
jgi:hypothetical protein